MVCRTKLPKQEKVGNFKLLSYIRGSITLIPNKHNSWRQASSQNSTLIPVLFNRDAAPLEWKSSSKLYTEFPQDQRIYLKLINSQRISHWTMIQPYEWHTNTIITTSVKNLRERRVTWAVQATKLRNKPVSQMTSQYHLSLLQFPGKRNLYFSEFSRRKAGRWTAE